MLPGHKNVKRVERFQRSFYPLLICLEILVFSDDVGPVFWIEAGLALHLPLSQSPVSSGFSVDVGAAAELDERTISEVALETDGDNPGVLFAVQSSGNIYAEDLAGQGNGKSCVGFEIPRGQIPKAFQEICPIRHGVDPAAV